MLSHTIKHVYVAQYIIDFRKRLSGLLAEAYFLELDPYAGDCLVVVHRERNKMRVLCGDDFGAWILERHFENGRLEQKFKFILERSYSEITQAELSMLLDGNAYVVEKRANKWKTNISQKLDAIQINRLDSSPYEENYRRRNASHTTIKVQPNM